MNRTTTPRSNLICSIIYIAFISLFITLPSTAQNHLIPGYWGTSDNYESALKTVFSEAYVPEVRLRVQIQSKYGTENITGVRTDSTGYHLFHILPEKSVWYSSWVDIPCRDSDGNELPERPGKTCSSLDFSSVDTIRVSNFQTAIDSSLAQKLISLWEETLIQSSYREASNAISTGGVTYQYSAFKFGLGNIQGYSRNPEDSTFTGKFTALSRLMRSTAMSEINVVSDSLINQINVKADLLMKELLNYGDTPPSRTQLNRILRGCDAKFRDMVENDYCWQAYLTDNEVPNLIIANKNTEEYIFEMVDLADISDIKKIQIIPVISIHHPSKRGEKFAGWQNYLLEPWDIVDLMTHTQSVDWQVFGYRNFTLENDKIHYNSDSVIIRFDGLFSNRDKREHLMVVGDHEWFSITSLFKDK